ncbi:hypothetical protein C1646_769517 [Rhizophagus diaphanus]|nr:hypothetical protein C1646_769517 [Rhizophagus diaphanus] [Rhizophagus sp. MUCL 43196]
MRRSGDYCGGSFVDQEFLKFLESKVRESAINQVKEDHYCRLQFMIQEFVRTVYSQFEDTELKLEEICPVISQYCKENKLNEDDCESKYLQSRIKQEFSSKVKLIPIPPQPSYKNIENQSQEQMINLLRQTLELKENRIQNFEKEKEELDTKIHQQRIDRSQQSLKLVRNQMKILEKEKDE